ncbi:unnamed protein product, partial [Effrenium voratum]
TTPHPPLRAGDGGSSATEKETGSAMQRTIVRRLPPHLFERPEDEQKFRYARAMAEKSRASMVGQWRSLGRGKKKQAWPAADEQVGVDTFILNLRMWLLQRSLTGCLERMEGKDPAREDGEVPRPFLYYKYQPPNQPDTSPLRPQKNWAKAYHGTWFYGLWSILHHGILLESQDEGQGHEFWFPGAFVSPLLETANWYSRPHDVFGDEMFHRVIVEVYYDPKQVKKIREKGGKQVIVPSSGVAVSGVIFQPNSPPEKGRERFESWDNELEVVPETVRQRREGRFNVFTPAPPPPPPAPESKEQEALKQFLEEPEEATPQIEAPKKKRKAVLAPAAPPTPEPAAPAAAVAAEVWERSRSRSKAVREKKKAKKGKLKKRRNRGRLRAASSSDSGEAVAGRRQRASSTSSAEKRQRSKDLFVFRQATGCGTSWVLETQSGGQAAVFGQPKSTGHGPSFRGAPSPPRGMWTVWGCPFFLTEQVPKRQPLGPFTFQVPFMEMSYREEEQVGHLEFLVKEAPIEDDAL